MAHPKNLDFQKNKKQPTTKKSGSISQRSKSPVVSKNTKVGP